jgi:AraC-like DNA-binding protein
MQHPSFDTWTTIFLFAAIQGIFVSGVLFFTKKENRFNNSLIALLLFLFSFTLIEYVLYWTHYMVKFPHVMALSSAFPFLFGVILWIYFRNVFENKKISLHDAKHLTPFVLYIIYLLPFYLSTASVKREWFHGNLVQPSLFSWPKPLWILRTWFPWLMIVHMIVYALFIYRNYNAISKTNHEVRMWFKWVTGMFVLFIASFTSYYVLVQFPFFNNAWDYMISFSMMFFIYFIAWFGYRQPKIFSGFTLNESAGTGERYKNSALDQEVSREILTRLLNTMEVRKLYRESDLRLEKLADELDVSKHHLSQVINEQTGMNFFEYINKLRITEAKQLLSAKTKKELNILEVAFSVGFNNKVSFNSTFKKITGQTPTEFRKSSEENKEPVINQ